MKRFVTRLAALATVGAAVGFVPAAHAQPAGGAAAPAPSQRICIVNIAKVLRDYNKANFQGQQITEKRQAYVTQVNALREQLAKINKDHNLTQVQDDKKKLAEQALAVQRQIEDIDRKAQTELTQLSNTTIVAVYQEIKTVIKDIAEANNLAMVLCYPAASKPEDEASPQVAQLMLQTPAMIPFYHRGMDITETVIKTLNGRYPAPEVKKPDVTTTGGTAPAIPGKQ
ncbi:MAG TPA: OmpH family outer membrane protein [Gemmataceae bacterium]|nr:OmpH family outer membrane protein [Gemmataceae bacterium]